MYDRLLFSEPMPFRGEPCLGQAIVKAACQAHTTSAEWMRKAVRNQLTAEGVALPPIDTDTTKRQAALRPASLDLRFT